MPKLINWLVVGAQKAGTTALYNHLLDCSSLCLAQKKELHYFDDETVDWDRPDYSEYEKNWPESPSLKGEITPIYSYWPDSLERIHRYNPSMKLVFVLRDRVQRAWSHWKMERARGFESLPFSTAIRSGRDRIGCDTDSRNGHHRVFSYVERGFYGLQIDRAQKLFGPDNIHLMRSQHLRFSPASELKGLGDFLGVSIPEAAQKPRIIHEGQAWYGKCPSAADVAYLRDIFADDEKRFRDLTDVVIPTEYTP